jgi:hypothetical protein
MVCTRELFLDLSDVFRGDRDTLKSKAKFDYHYTGP